ncbi:MAG: hypothetical protein MJ212_04825, partial [Alphaproteobacteria bacterium]|nr:hypothetical protein [Alphaproteobacteria bacterium]
MEETTEKTEESRQTQNIDNVYTDVFDESQGQESALIKAQRYLNIFRQIHIFTPEKRKEFDTSLLLIDSRTKEILASIPGGKVLLDHLHKLQEQNGLEHDTTPFVSAKTALGNEEQISSTPINTAQAATAVDVGTPIELNSTFAKDLAQSLAAALKVNNMIPQQQNNDLPKILNNSLGTYAANLQKMTEEFFTKHLQHFDDMQTRWLSQFHEQINLQNDYQNKFLSQQTQQIQLLNQQQSKQIQQLQSQNSQQFEQLQARSVSSHSMGTRQLNTQTNNANSTTINNVNFDPQSLRLGDITSAIIETFKETNKQQLLTLKEMGENLSKSIIQSQRELSETILKARPHIHIEQSSKENENFEPVQKGTETVQPINLSMGNNKPIDITKNFPFDTDSEDKKNKNTDKSVQTKKENKPSNSDNAFKPQNKEANTPANKLTKEALQPKQDIKSEKEKDKNKNNKDKSVDILLNDVEDVEISTIFSHQNNQPTEKISKEKNSDKPEPKKENKETVSAPLKE